jgi:hypothetical protein
LISFDAALIASFDPDSTWPFAVIPEAIETAAEWEDKFKPKTEH